MRGFLLALGAVLCMAQSPAAPGYGGSYGLTHRSMATYALGTSILTVGAQQLPTMVGISDATGAQPMPGDSCRFALASGSSLAPSITLPRCDVTAAGTVMPTATASVAGVSISGTIVNVFWDH